ncbi:hypothetical protein L0P88_01415 [Muricauda sp. SCSIO 64092]|uniref:hypothetical protein n=1 Tax=Allomuricauda sp. SCSIO 64092 TaxID=2908842 RepID=UPI001FF38503|nr:hypothetical protein [Muricauda sp. SCSIO 64092]UOY07223.1 hypothetical protein L0P88_01415 [Muricauda sp. SCSIO 64092]
MPSRKELNKLYRDPAKPQDYDQLVQNLCSKVFNNEEISLAEEQFIGGIIELLRNKEGERAFKIEDYPNCKNYHFRSRYLRYISDLNGHKEIMDYYGRIPQFQKQKDVAFLQKTYEEWEEHLNDKKNGFQLENYVAQETDQQLKILDKYAKDLLIGDNYREYLRKTIVLHGKYIYLLVAEFYQELGKKEEIIELNNHKILIDGFTYVHTMFRHFSSHIKQYQLKKSYHFDTNIGFKEIPTFLIDAIHSYKTLSESILFDQRKIYF